MNEPVSTGAQLRRLIASQLKNPVLRLVPAGGVLQNVMGAVDAYVAETDATLAALARRVAELEKRGK